MIKLPTSKSELYELIYSKGRNQVATIIFHEDGGHGWLQVQKSLVQDLEIEKKISTYSYIDKQFYYLEEDCDLTVFFIAMKLDTNKDLAKEFWEAVPNKYKDDSFVRHLSRVTIQ